MKRKCVAALTALLLAHAAPTWALDPASAQAYCDEVKKAAREAQLRYVQTYQPRVDPVKTFDDATGSCLEFISMFEVGFTLNIPSLGDIDAFLRNMAMKLLQRACQAATQQFNNAVNNAVQSVTNATGINNINNLGIGNVPLVSGGITTGTDGVGLSGGVTVKGDGGSAVSRTIERVTDRVINLVR